MNSMHKPERRGAHNLNQRTLEELLYLLVFGWSPMSEGWPRSDTYENIDKNGKNYMHWNVALDTLPGSATI